MSYWKLSGLSTQVTIVKCQLFFFAGGVLGYKFNLSIILNKKPILVWSNRYVLNQISMIHLSKWLIVLYFWLYHQLLVSFKTWLVWTYVLNLIYTTKTLLNNTFVIQANTHIVLLLVVSITNADIFGGDKNLINDINKVPKVEGADLITWCTTSVLEQAKCEKLARSVMQDKGLFGRDYIELQCKRVNILFSTLKYFFISLS